MRKPLALAAFASLLAFGLFLAYLIPFNDSAFQNMPRDAAHAAGLIGFACGIEWLLGGLLVGLVSIRKMGTGDRTSDLMLATLFGLIMLPSFGVDHYLTRRRVNRRIAALCS